MCPSLCTSLARGLPLCVASSRAAMFPACTLPCPLVQPPPSLPSLSFSLQGPGRIGEPCTGCGAVSAAARRGLPRPGRCEQGGMGGPSLRFTLNPQNSPELEKCSIRSIGAADRPSAVGWGRRAEARAGRGSRGAQSPPPGDHPGCNSGVCTHASGSWGSSKIVPSFHLYPGGLWAFQNSSPGPGLLFQNEPKPGLHPQHQINQSWGKGGRRIRNPRSSSAM